MGKGGCCHGGKRSGCFEPVNDADAGTRALQNKPDISQMGRVVLGIMLHTWMGKQNEKYCYHGSCS